MGASVTDLLKKAGKIIYEILVAWANFGKNSHRPADTDADGIGDGSPLPPDIGAREFNIRNGEPYRDLCPGCGRKRMLTRWVKLAEEEGPSLYCEECASSMEAPESVATIPP